MAMARWEGEGKVEATTAGRWAVGKEEDDHRAGRKWAAGATSGGGLERGNQARGRRGQRGGRPDLGVRELRRARAQEDGTGGRKRVGAGAGVRRWASVRMSKR